MDSQIVHMLKSAAVFMFQPDIGVPNGGMKILNKKTKECKKKTCCSCEASYQRQMHAPHSVLTHRGQC